MNKQTLFSIVEIVLFTFSFFTALVRLPLIKINSKQIIISLFTIIIISIGFYTTDGDYHIGLLKVILFFSFIYLGYEYKKAAVWIVVIILLTNSAMSYFSNWKLDKFSAIPISFIALLITSFYVKSKNIKYLLITLIIIDIIQNIYTEYRGQLLYCFLILFCITFNISIYKKISSLFLITCVGYIVTLYFIGLSYFSLQETILPPTASNIERSSMIYWCINSIPNYLFNAPTVQVFQENAGVYKTIYSMSSHIPNDPHNFLLMLYIFLGFFPATIFFCLIYFLIKKGESRWIKNQERPWIKNRDNYITLAIFQVIIIFSLHPFDHLSRLIVGMTFGLFVISERRKYKRKVI
ncbi:hypothetical protein [Arsenophonus apicola]|uniref:O-antigen polymerase n=1 Tax=Arsenophonus apicola TaxID=2879119 RepID=A0ABY8P2B0_9GAMM|nr:hypothetical protein [Arsenophonus apicola]WGO83640.1 hypothetical protein QG404_01545 [Arsenophonus apicola]